MAIQTNLTKEQADAIPEPKTVQFYENVYTVFTEDTPDVVSEVIPTGV